MTDFWLTTLTGIAWILGACLAVVVIAVAISLLWRDERHRRVFIYADGMVDPDDLLLLPGVAIPVAGDPREVVVELAEGRPPDQWPGFPGQSAPYDWERDEFRG